MGLGVPLIMTHGHFVSGYLSEFANMDAVSPARDCCCRAVRDWEHS